MNLEIQRRLAAIVSRWNDVERHMKQVELLRSETIYAAVNELRYAGRKIADALLLISGGKEDAETFAKINEHLVIAENYLVNADHDLSDAAILYISLRVKRIIELHGLAKVATCFPEFKELSELLKEAQSTVIQSRGDRQNRIEIYKTLVEKHVPELIRLYVILASNPDLNLREGPFRLAFREVSIIALIGALAALGSFAVNLWAYHMSVPAADIKQIEQVIRDYVKPVNSDTR